MAKPGDPATYDTLLKETAEEAKILVEALFQLLGLEVSPWPIKGRDTAIETLVETVPPLVQSIFTNLRYVFENGFQSQDDIHAGALFGMFNKYAPLILKAAGEPAIAALDFVKEPLMNMGNIAPGDQDKVASEIFGRAWTMGEMAHGLAILSGILPTGLGAAFSGFAAQVSLASGFREIAMAIHRSWYGIGIARPTAYKPTPSSAADTPAATRARRFTRAACLRSRNATSSTPTTGWPRSSPPPHRPGSTADSSPACLFA